MLWLLRCQQRKYNALKTGVKKLLAERNSKCIFSWFSNIFFDYVKVNKQNLLAQYGHRKSYTPVKFSIMKKLVS